jgi:hypothetical protein
LYFVADHDGCSCIWAQHLEPSSERRQGEAVSVAHFHQARLAIAFSTALSAPR